MEQGGGGFLPPDPGGREPELSAPAQQGWAPPHQAQQQPQPAWQHSGWAPPPAEPDNGAAVAGFVVSVVSASLLVFTFGFASVITVVSAPFGIYYSRRGKAAVERGDTRKHEGLAQAGFVIGIITMVLSVIAVAVGVIFLIVFLTDPGFRRDFENDPPGGGGGGGGGFDTTTATLVLTAARLLARVAGAL